VALATWIHNASPNSKTGGKSPDELVHGIQKDLSGLVPFYSKGWAYITKEEKANKKFKAKAHRVKFLGFAPEYKNAAIVQTDSGKILTRRDVIFDEHPPDINSDDMEHIVDGFSEPAVLPKTGQGLPVSNRFDPLSEDEDDVDSDPSDTGNQDGTEDPDASQTEAIQSPSPTEHGENQEKTGSPTPVILPEPPLPRNVRIGRPRTTRGKKPARFVETYHAALRREYNDLMHAEVDNWHRYIMSLPEEGVPMPSLYNTEKTNEELPYTPTNLKEALSPDNPWREQWLKATNLETGELFDRGTLVDLEEGELEKSGKKPFKSKFTFKIKKTLNGLIFKARLCGCGYSQRLGVDYDETYAPTVSYHTVILLLHIASVFKTKVIANDIGNAYLEALADKLLFMWMPLEWTNGEKVAVRVAGNIYGTKQATLLWYNLLYGVLFEFGFKRSMIDEQCLFILQEESDMILLIVYVNDWKK